MPLMALVILGTSVLGASVDAKARIVYSTEINMAYGNSGWEDYLIDKYGWTKKQVLKYIKDDNNDGTYFLNCSWVSTENQLYNIQKAKLKKKGYKSTLKLSDAKVTIKKGQKASVYIKGVSKKNLKKNGINIINCQSGKDKRGYVKKEHCTMDYLDMYKTSEAKANKNTGKVTITGKKKGCSYIIIRTGKKFNAVKVTVE